MNSKKALIWSTLIGIVIASIVIIFVVLPLLSAGYRLIFPQPDYATLQGFERLWTAIESATDKPSYIPISLKSGFKITTNPFDSNCIENCICLCKEDNLKNKGCILRIYNEKCTKNGINLNGEFSLSIFKELYHGDLQKEDVPALLEVSKKSGGTIDIAGKYLGKCNFDNYEGCISSGECFAKFRYLSVTLAKIPVGKMQSFGCSTCQDNLLTPEGKTAEVYCERYSYYELQKDEDKFESSFIIPFDFPEYENAVKQCSKDPCGLKARGYECSFEYDEEANAGTCKTVKTPAP